MHHQVCFDYETMQATKYQGNIYGFNEDAFLVTVFLEDVEKGLER